MRVALQVTCINDALFPETGKAVVTLLRRLGRRRRVPAGADLLRAADGEHRLPRRGGARVRTFVEAFRGYDAIVTPSGSCAGSATAPAPDRGRALRRRLAGLCGRGDGATRLRADRVPRRPARGDRRGRVLPAPGDLPPDLPLAPDAEVGDRPRMLLEQVHGLRLVELPAAEECCGFGGTFAMKNADTSIAMGSDKARHVRATGAEVLVAGDSSCLMHIGGLLSRAALRGAHDAPGRGPGGDRGRAEACAGEWGGDLMAAPSWGCRRSRWPRGRHSRTRSCATTWPTPPRRSARSVPGWWPRSTTGRTCARPAQRSRTRRWPTSSSTSSSSSRT